MAHHWFAPVSFGRVSLALLALCVLNPLQAEEPQLNPVRVCELTQNVAAYDGKVVAVVARYSFRHTGRTISEETCGKDPGGPVRIVFDKKLAPKTPLHLEIDGANVQKLLRAIQQQTSLAKFKFGTPDYDRWAIVYGRFEASKADGNQSPQIICAGDSEVIFIVDRY